MNKFDERIHDIGKFGDGAEFVVPLTEVADTLETLTLAFDDLGIEKDPGALAALVGLVFQRKDRAEILEAQKMADSEND